MKVFFDRISGNVSFLSGTATLNANDVNRQRFEVELSNDLVVGALSESLYVVFSHETGISTHDILISGYNAETKTYYISFPSDVIKTAGDWDFQLYIRVYDGSELFSQEAQQNKTTFTVSNGLKFDDDGAPIPQATMSELFSATKQAVETCKTYATQVQNSPPGSTAQTNLSIGSVTTTTIAAGTNAEVKLELADDKLNGIVVGKKLNFTFKIPKGQNGSNGEDGENGVSEERVAEMISEAIKGLGIPGSGGNTDENTGSGSNDSTTTDLKFISYSATPVSILEAGKSKVTWEISGKTSVVSIKHNDTKTSVIGKNSYTFIENVSVGDTITLTISYGTDTLSQDIVVGGIQPFYYGYSAKSALDGPSDFDAFGHDKNGLQSDTTYEINAEAGSYFYFVCDNKYVINTIKDKRNNDTKVSLSKIYNTITQKIADNNYTYKVYRSLGKLSNNSTLVFTVAFQEE